MNLVKTLLVALSFGLFANIAAADSAVSSENPVAADVATATVDASADKNKKAKKDEAKKEVVAADETQPKA